MEKNEIDVFFVKNFKKINNYCKRNNIDEDEINRVYLKIIDSKLNDNFKLTLGYIYRTMWNKKIDNHRHSSTFKKAYIEDFTAEQQIYFEELLLINDEITDYNYVREEQLNFLTKTFFNFITKTNKFNDEEQYIIKTYYFNKNMSYNKVKEITKYSKTSISNIIIRFKLIFKEEFEQYYLNNLNND